MFFFLPFTHEHGFVPGDEPDDDLPIEIEELIGLGIARRKEKAALCVGKARLPKAGET
jgi:hypothetical protein